MPDPWQLNERRSFAEFGFEETAVFGRSGAIRESLYDEVWSRARWRPPLV